MNELRSRIIALLVASGMALTAVAQTAPRSFSSYFFFGDSLTDNGNTFALTGSPPAPYFNGRVSNGITYAEYLRSGLAAASTAAPTVRTNLNFAFAGATAAAGSAVPSLAQQIGLFQARGITPASNDLFVLLAGANDVLNAISNPATQNVAGVTSAAITASSAVSGAVQSLATLGARNIVVLNLPDISRTARFVTGTGAPAASLALTGSSAFNKDLAGRIAALNLPTGTNVTVVSLEAIFRNILNNPARFGFTNTTQEYLGILQAGGNPGNVNGYIFWDGIHPTTRTHAIFAQALNEALTPEYALGFSGTIGTASLVAADMTAGAIDSRLDLTRYGAARQADGWINYLWQQGGRDASGYSPGFDYTAHLITAGVDTHYADNLVIGGALTKESIDVKHLAAGGSFKLSGAVLTAYAQWRAGGFFAEVSGNYGTQDVRRITRTTTLGGMAASGKTEAARWGGAIKVGGDFAFDSAHFTPFVGIRYSRVELDGYTESGVEGLDFAHADSVAKSVAGIFGASADWQIMKGERPLALNLSAVYQKDLASDQRMLAGQLANTVSARGQFGVADGLDESIRVGARLNGAIAKRWGWAVGYVAEFRDDGDTAKQFSVTLHTGF
jgi:outer membrane lipase/esterase